jgi:hypothetical protein
MNDNYQPDQVDTVTRVATDTSHPANSLLDDITAEIKRMEGWPHGWAEWVAAKIAAIKATL